VLYLGRVPAMALPEVETAVREIASTLPPAQLCAEGVTCFPGGKDGVPVAMPVRRGWGLDALYRALLVRLAHVVTQRQHAEYRPHVTLGYAAALSPEQQAAAMEVAVPPIEWTAARLEVRYGPEVTAVVPLTGRADGGGRG
jgi:2'-5' RNA ligase